MKTKIRLQISDLLNNRFKLNTGGLIEKYSELLPLWEEIEPKFLKGLKKITGLNFSRNLIDVYLINYDNMPPISFPVIVKVFPNVNKTIRIIMHEIIHNLMWDNVQENNWSKKIQELYLKENRITAIHVAVHAILKALYVDILDKPDEINNNINESQKWEDYKRAWEIVEKEGYQNIIDKLKYGGK